jgi:RNA polymerase sigma-70 factor (ECF subfamily)
MIGGFFLNIEEHQLIRKSQDGDEQAFDVLVKRYYSQILKHCFSLIGDQEKAEDLTQETFIRAFSKISQFHEKSSFYTWIWKISHNLSLNSLKREKKEELPLKEELIESLEIKEELLFSEIEHYLSQKERDVFYLYYEKQLSQKEIAFQLNIPHGTVRSRLHSGKKRLNKQLVKKEGFLFFD